MLIRERNKLIKKELSKIFGFKNVKVRGSRGTAYGWIHIYITTEKPHTGPCKINPENAYFKKYCPDCIEKQKEVENTVWKVLTDTGLNKEISFYYDDMNFTRPECTIHVNLIETEEKNIKNQSTTVKENSQYKIIYEKKWTWIYFPTKPDEKFREKLKAQGFKFSRKRKAWYKPEKVGISLSN